MQYNIDLLILPPHCSHILQPLDVAVFGPLKTALASETDQLIKVGVRRIQKVEWIEIYYKARLRAISQYNIQSVWLGAGIYPFNPQNAYNVPHKRAPHTRERHHNPPSTSN